MSSFQKNQKIKLLNGSEITVIDAEPLGEGAQGEVYKVSYKGKDCALKWYKAKSILDNADQFIRNLEDNIQKGSPASQFLWPIATTVKINRQFGYVMPLISKEMDSFSDYLLTYKLDVSKNGKQTRNPVGFASVDQMIVSAIQLTSQFKQLHRKGLSFQDLNDGGIFIDMNTGRVEICDCDNVVPDEQNLGIGGKPGYIAPEIVAEKKKPNLETDQFSLANVLFRLFMNSDPLYGAKVLKSCTLTGEAEIEHYGRNPVFIFDPNDQSNRPVNGVHNNAIRKWPLYPEYLREAFIRSFTEGMKDPDKRIIDNEWSKILLRLKSDVVNCDCGAGSRFLSCTDLTDGKYTCSKCGRIFCTMDFGGTKTALTIGQHLYEYQTRDRSEDYEQVQQTVIENKKHPGVLGLRNESDRQWTVTYQDSQKEVPPGGTAPINDGMTVDFGYKKTGTTKS